MNPGVFASTLGVNLLRESYFCTSMSPDSLADTYCDNNVSIITIVCSKGIIATGQVLYLPGCAKCLKT